MSGMIIMLKLIIQSPGADLEKKIKEGTRENFAN